MYTIEHAHRRQYRCTKPGTDALSTGALSRIAYSFNKPLPLHEIVSIRVKRHPNSRSLHHGPLTSADVRMCPPNLMGDFDSTTRQFTTCSVSVHVEYAMPRAQADLLTRSKCVALERRDLLKTDWGSSPSLVTPAPSPRPPLSLTVLHLDGSPLHLFFTYNCISPRDRPRIARALVVSEKARLLVSSSQRPCSERAVSGALLDHREILFGKTLHSC